MLNELIQHVLNFAIMFIIIRLLVYGPVKRFMDERSARLAAEQEAADKSRREAEQLKEEYQRKMDVAQDAADQLLAKSEEQAKEAGEQLLAENRKQAAQMLENARSQVVAERQAMLEQMQGEFATTAVRIASKILEREVTVEDNEAVIQDFFDEVG